MKICTRCGKESNDFRKRTTGYYDSSCGSCEKQRISRIKAELKEKVFQKYGNVCCRCGFSDKRALQIDHVNNNGSIDRKESRNHITRFLRKVLSDTTGQYQILCANCNWIKHIETHNRL